MSSYVVKTDDIRELIKSMEALKGVQGRFDYKAELVECLMQPDFRRIKWFFYCDNFEGNSIRVFDRQLMDKYKRLFLPSESWMLLRGHRLGQENESIKHEMLRLFPENKREGEYPRFVTHKGEKDCLDYFEKLNVDSDQTENSVMPADLSQQLSTNHQRYRALSDDTFLQGEFFESLERLLLNHKQVILEGPPGSGKTWVARKFAKWWTESGASGADTSSKWNVVQFHESYGYEDFFQGIRPQLLDVNGKVIASSDTVTTVEKMVYRNANGVFYDFCETARNAPDARFVLVIDEINRGKASRIFGELLYLLEYRDEEITLASGEQFRVPPNVYLIGTMNTADRSIALVDYALRRRFKFIAIDPWSDGDAPVLRRWLQAKSISDAPRIVHLFCRLNDRVSKLNPHFVVGHSYFMHPELAGRTPDISPIAFPKNLLDAIWRFSITPLLSEYEPSRSMDELEADYGLESLLKTV